MVSSVAFIVAASLSPAPFSAMDGLPAIGLFALLLQGIQVEGQLWFAIFHYTVRHWQVHIHLTLSIVLTTPPP